MVATTVLRTIPEGLLAVGKLNDVDDHCQSDQAKVAVRPARDS